MINVFLVKAAALLIQAEAPDVAYKNGTSAGIFRFFESNESPDDLPARQKRAAVCSWRLHVDLLSGSSQPQSLALAQL